MSSDDHARLFGAARPRAPRFHGMTVQSHYVTMRDGVQLAAEVWLPKGLPRGERLPALLNQTRYWRAMELRPPLGWFLSAEDLVRELRPMKPFHTGRGYALVYVDERGTGASFGTWPYPWSDESVLDAEEVLNWIVAQPWSSGQVGGFGVSYTGTTAELLAVTHHPAVRALLPMFNHPDAFVDIAFPGGILNRRFIEVWGEMDWRLDQNELPGVFGVLPKLAVRGVKPVAVAEGGGRALLAEALRDHARNGYVFQTAQRVVFRDQVDEALGVSMDHLAVHHRRSDIESGSVPVMGWGSWMDAGTADAVLRRFAGNPGARRAVIGAWDHGGLSHASPYQAALAPTEPPLPAQWAEALHFFDAHLLDGSDEVQTERVLHYYTLGAERWQRTDVWPPRGAAMQRWFLAGDGRLARQGPDDDIGVDTYTVDWAATTGLQNRWWEMGGVMRQTVSYRRRAEAARHLLAYTTPPLDRDTEIAGHPVVSLSVRSSEPDCAFYAYLEDVDEQGQVTYLTEGQLRSIHRRVAADPPYHVFVPYHSFEEADAMPLVPGQVADVTFGLLPVSAVVRRGHRLRLGIAGHDADTFVRVPAAGTPEWEVGRSRNRLSWLDVPVRSAP